jgi:cytochrome c oxidase subunit 3
MPIIGEHVEIERKPKLGGGGPGKIPHRRGYGGGDDDDRDRRRDFYSSRQRLRRGRVGVAIVITLVTVMFIALTVVYVARQGGGPYDPDHLSHTRDWKPLALPYLQLWINSLLLVFSSMTLERARRGMTRKAEFANMGIVPPQRNRDFSWLALTLGLGVAFLCGQLLAWNTLRLQGAFRGSNPSSKFFVGFITLHALHLVGGLLVLLYASCGHWLRMKFESQRINVEITAWYWHFLGVLWFGIFALLHFAKG